MKCAVDFGCGSYEKEIFTSSVLLFFLMCFYTGNGVYFSVMKVLFVLIYT